MTSDLGTTTLRAMMVFSKMSQCAQYKSVTWRVWVARILIRFTSAMDPPKVDSISENKVSGSHESQSNWKVFKRAKSRTTGCASGWEKRLFEDSLLVAEEGSSEGTTGAGSASLTISNRPS